VASRAKKLTETQLRAKFSREVVGPLFPASWKPPAGTSAPPVVLENRRKRAQSRIVEALVSRGSATLTDAIRAELKSLVSLWSSVLFDDGYSGAEKFEIDRAKERAVAMAMESGDPKKVRELVENEYRRRVIEQYGRIELRGLGTSHRILLDIDRVFVPMTLEGKPEGGSGLRALLGRRMNIEGALAESPRLQITGAPGSGKSTLLGWLAAFSASRREMPFVLPVRSLTDGAITSEQIARFCEISEEYVAAACKEGIGLLLIDGLDEASGPMQKALKQSVEAIGAREPKLRIVLTSRPAAADDSFKGFTPYRLADLAPHEVDEFVDKWCLAAELSAPRKGDPEQVAKEAATDLKRRIERRPSVQRIAVNPLLTTIVCVVHRFLGKSVPEHRVTLYDKCTDVLLYEWDRAKFPDGSNVGRLDANAKRTLLRGLARKMHDAGDAEVAEALVVGHFRELLPSLGAKDADPAALLAEIRDRSGLLVEKRPGYFGFAHLTFQEYLTALDYGFGGDWKKLPAKSKQHRWHEVIALTAGVSGVDAGWLITELLNARSNEAVVLAARCLETATSVPLAVRERTKAELKRLLPPSSPEEAGAISNMGATVAPLLLEMLPTVAGLEFRNTMIALAATYYVPAVPVIARYLTHPVHWVDAAGSLLMFHSKNDAAIRALREWLPNCPGGVLEVYAREYPSHPLYDLIVSLLKQKTQESQPAARSKRTA